MLRLLALLLLLAGSRAHAQPAPDAWARAVLDTLSLDAKLGQLFVTDASLRDTLGTPRGVLRARLLRRVGTFGPGGVWFSRGTSEEQAALTVELQQRSALPLLIAQDMEHGAGMRLSDATAFPRAMALGASGDPALAYALGRHVGDEARALGVHHNYGPVADVNSNPANPIIGVRSFGEDPEAVGALVAAYVRGVQDGGVIATAKHFPGHGDTIVDSHDALPLLPFDRARLDTTELVPFRRAVGAGVRSVMTGHLAVPALDSDPLRPATLSPEIVGGVLRGEMGFDGLVVTDGLNMRGLTAHVGPGEAAVQAVEAGADLLLLSDDEPAARAALREAVRSGRIAEERVDASVLRILRAKAEAGLHQEPPMPAALDSLLLRRGDALAARIAGRAVTLLRNDRHRLPLRSDACALVLSFFDGTAEPATPFAERLREHLPAATHRAFGPPASPQALDHAFTLAEQHDVVVLALYRRVRGEEPPLSKPERALVHRLHAVGKPVVLVAFGSPYAPLEVERPAAEVVAYDAAPALQRAAADVLLGLAPASGRLPVSLPGLYRLGDGLARPATTLRYVAPEVAGFDPAVLARADSLIEAAIADHVFPGAVLSIGLGGQVVHERAYGHHTYEARVPVTTESVFDLASLTKVAATTLAAMKLYDEGRLGLDVPVARYVPAFAQGGKASVTVRHLLSHSAGLPASVPYHTMGLTADEARAHLYADSLRYAPGTATLYSDLGMIVLGEVIEAITGQPLDAYLRETFYGPLGMADTGFRAVGTVDPRALPTEIDETFRGRTIQGEVHDEKAALLGGVAGHAGLFSTAPDLARLAFLLTGGGKAYGRRFFAPETVETFTRRARPEGEYPAALGWLAHRPPVEGYSSGGQQMGPRAFGHTGFTGTSLWIDPDTKLWVILLTNRTYPHRAASAIPEVRAAVADLAVEAFEKGRAAAGTRPERGRYTGPISTQPSD